ncbi:MAG TPA: MmgE/PrpD family protein [Chloroflexota bacterium]|nr:MmgE/PrpD family protein [Chloroflexota bacterium]
MATAAEQLAGFCTGLRFDALPAEVVERTKDLLLDYLGVGYRGMAVNSSQAALRAAKSLGGAGCSTLFGQGEAMPAAWAALANGTAAHATEMDDVTTKSSLHPGVAVWPATLALGEELGASPEATLTAAVAGYEVVMRVGNALNPASAYERGFHPTGVAGAFGATAAAASLLGLDTPRFVHALGIAGTMASGSLEYLSGGAWTKRLNAGWAAHAGVVAARLAAEGFTGPATSIEGPLGALHAYTHAPLLEEATARLGESYQVMRVSIKPYACCRYNHGLIDCMLQLRARVPSPDDVEDIRLGVLSGGYLLVADPIERKRQPANVVDAQFSAPFAAAVALVHGRAGLPEYTQASVEDPRIRRLMARTTCYRDAELDAGYPALWPAAANIRLRSGEVLEARQPYPLGEPENPVSSEALAAKFRQLVHHPWAEDAIQAVYDLPAGSLPALMALFRN